MTPEQFLNGVTTGRFSDGEPSSPQIERRRSGSAGLPDEPFNHQASRLFQLRRILPLTYPPQPSYSGYVPTVNSPSYPSMNATSGIHPGQHFVYSPPPSDDYTQYSLAKRTSPAEISYGASRAYGISREKWRKKNARWV
ncbi:hypothetical protein JCM6882_008097 [Rhodosporidiobolus microsporus]